MEVDASSTETSPQKLLEIFQNIQLTRNKKTQLQIAIEAEKVSRSYNSGTDLEEVSVRIKELSDQISEEAAVKNAIELAVQRLQMSDVIYRLLADDSALTDGDEVLLRRHKNYVEEKLKRQTELSSEIVERTQELEELQHRVLKLKKESLVLAAKRKRLLAQLQEAKQQRNKEASPCSSDTQKVLERLHNTETTLRLITPILQNLIVGSGVNWAQDEYLKELMLSLGRPLEEELEKTLTCVLDDSKTDNTTL